MMLAPCVGPFDCSAVTDLSSIAYPWSRVDSQAAYAEKTAILLNCSSADSVEQAVTLFCSNNGCQQTMGKGLQSLDCSKADDISAAYDSDCANGVHMEAVDACVCPGNSGCRKSGIGGFNNCLPGREEAGILVKKLINDWNVRANPVVLGCVNPIRTLTDTWVVERNGKSPISLAQGDPSMFGDHMRVPDAAVSALVDVIQSNRFNGYGPSTGLPECRRAVADYLSASLPFELSEDDVLMTSGCTQAFHSCISALAVDGCNMLLPRPGFPVYETVCHYLGVQCRHYDLLPENDWEVNLEHLAALSDKHTTAIILCNPGNPSGHVYGYQHLSKVARTAASLRIPIIVDEVYGDMAFGKHKFVPMANFSSIVPILCVGGISKRWLAPGWRLGWVAVSDPQGILEKARVKEALTKLLQMNLGPCSLVQAAFPAFLKRIPTTFLDSVKQSLKSGAELSSRRIKKITGLDCPCDAQGSMFMLVRMDPSKFKTLKDDRAFAGTLAKEECVFVLPGSAFGISNWLRVVFALSLSELNEAWDRIEAFCDRHTNCI